MAYIITVRDQSSGGNALVKNLAVTDSLKKAVVYVIKLINARDKYFLVGIPSFRTSDALDAYGPGELGNPLLLFSSDFYKVFAEKAIVL